MRDRLRASIIGCALAWTGVAAGEELPDGFGALSLGMPWAEIEGIGGCTEL